MGRLIGWILLLWAVASFTPYSLVYLLTGQPYYQALPPILGGAIEVGLLVLYVGLPLWWLRRNGIPWREGLAWHRRSRRSRLWGMGGLAATLLWSWFLTRLIPLPETGSAQGQGYPFPQVLPVLAGLTILWLAAVVGEEAMFRGWMQTQLERHSPTWLSILLPALLYGLRHLPLDLYEGHEGASGWALRLLELYGLALIMGLIRRRTGSIFPTLILHGFLWWLVVLGVYGTDAGALTGLVIGLLVSAYAVFKRNGE